jgi:hypothetical protein
MRKFPLCLMCGKPHKPLRDMVEGSENYGKLDYEIRDLCEKCEKEMNED